jgi:hypothetical protein
MRAAAIGIGSNSVRMLVADVQGGKLLEVLRDREGTRLFGGLNENGNLSRESMNHTLSAVRQMQQKAMALKAETIHLFATSAVRDAGNQQEFSSLIRNDTGLVLEICSGESEAALSFLGRRGPDPPASPSAAARGGPLRHDRGAPGALGRRADVGRALEHGGSPRGAGGGGGRLAGGVGGRPGRLRRVRRGIDSRLTVFR